MLKLVLLLLATLAASFVAAETAYFAFRTHGDNHDFVVKLTDDKKIAEARKILNGEETESVHVMGRIKKSRVPYNPHYEFHYDPDTVSFFLMAIEVCDVSYSYVDDHIDEACGAFLPGCFHCPWTSKLTREIKLDAATANCY